MKLFVVLVTILYICDGIVARRKNSHFYWKKPRYVMPWLKGPNVCAIEEVMGSRKRYYSECMAFMPRQICGKQTFIRYHCCSGYEKAEGDTKGCRAVAPVENLSRTMTRLHLNYYQEYAASANLDLLEDTNGTYTVFVPENRAFQNTSESTLDRFTKDDHEMNLLTYHITKGRHYLRDLLNKIELPSLHQDNPPLRINRYANGIVTVNCARVIIPDIMASNGLFHVIEKVIEPIPESSNLMEVLLGDDRFGELVTAMIVTQLGNALRDNSKFLTIFAPTDTAFRKAPVAVVERILEDKDILQKLLKYHMVEHNLCSAAILGQARLPTLEGQKVNLTCGTDDRIQVNGNPVSQTDIMASNGVIHVLEDILIPDSAKTLHEVLQEEEHYEFLEYAQQAGVAEMLKGKDNAGNFTVFVPSAECFQNMTTAEKRALQSSQKRVKNTLQYHISPGTVLTRTIRGGQTVPSITEKGIQLRLDVINGGFSVNGAKIISSNHKAGNGVVHVVDRILHPPSDNARWKLRQESTLGTFRALIDTARMDHLLTDDNGNFTYFAPNDIAFDNMDSNRIERLVHNKAELKKFLGYHIVRQPVYTTLVRPRLQYRFETRVDGEWIQIRREEPGAPLVVNDSAKILSDPIEATNGVIYIIDVPLECPCLTEVKTNDVY